jgi:hypothetical protein
MYCGVFRKHAKDYFNKWYAVVPKKQYHERHQFAPPSDALVLRRMPAAGQGTRPNALRRAKLDSSLQRSYSLRDSMESGILLE